MLKRADQYNLDWHRNKGVEVKKRGSISFSYASVELGFGRKFYSTASALRMAKSYGSLRIQVSDPQSVEPIV